MPQFPASHLAHLEAALEDALANVPFYARWKAKDPGKGTPPLERFRKLPTLARRELRAGFPKLFTPKGKDLKSALDSGETELVATSGTTEDRVQVIWWQPWWDKQEEAQYLTGNPLSKSVWGDGFKEVVLTTPVCSGGVCHIGDLSMKERIHERMLFLNQKADPAHWSERDLQRMAAELNEYAPQALEADPAYLAALSRYAAEKNIPLYKPKYIGLTYEFISRTHLAAIARAFGDVPIMNSYGSTEAGCLHMNCEHGRLHANLDWTHVDVLPLQDAHGGPRLGRIVASVLQNPWLKLLRYETGDLARLAEGDCPCGRPGESLTKIEGRVKDVTFTTGGRLVSVEQVDAAIGDLAGLEQYQVTQEAEGKYFVKYIPLPEADERLQREVPARLRDVYQGGQVAMQRETTIQPEPSGKYRLAKCELPFDPFSFFAERA